MFRIVRFKVPQSEVVERLDLEDPDLNRLREQSPDIQLEGDFYVSAPMSTTSAQYFIVEQTLRCMFGDPSHLFEDLTPGYRLLRTSAPKAYDYDYCIDIGTMKGEWANERLVAVPRKSVEYQSGRWSSGMFTPVACG